MNDNRIEGRFFYSVWGATPIEVGYKLRAILSPAEVKRAINRNVTLPRS